MRTISATRFKAQCLALLDEVNRTHERITITKRGKPVADLVPSVGDSGSYPQRNLRGSVVLHGDIVGPVAPEEEWEATR